VTDFFPPDVSVRLRGDRTLAQTHLGGARRMLFKALNIGETPVSLVEHLEDGTTMHVLLLGQQKIVTIDAPPSAAPEQPTAQEQPIPRLEVAGLPVMYSGWMRGAEFYPSAPCAAAYRLETKWQLVGKLTYQGRVPSQYSGTMKKVVQAVMGLGTYRDGTPDYLTGVATASTQTATNQYGPGWTQTHGIYKAGTKNHWLVEVSQSRGVLAMPLPLVPSTTTPRFRAFLLSRGDTDSLKVFDEFGGIPSGKTISLTGTPLEQAITAGKVLRLLTASALGAFYTGRVSLSPDLGWAFSTSGASAVATAIDHTRLAGAYHYLASATAYYQSPLPNDISVRSHFYRLNFTLSVHNARAPFGSPPQPCGTGSATLELVHVGRISPETFVTTFTPTSGPNVRPYIQVGPWYGYLRNNYYPSWGWQGPLPLGGENNDAWGATLGAFYRGEALERVKWMPAASPTIMWGHATSALDNRTFAGTSTAQCAVMAPYCRESYLVCRFGGAQGYTYAGGRIISVPPVAGTGGAGFPVLGLGAGNLVSMYSMKVSARDTQYRATNGIHHNWPLSPAPELFGPWQPNVAMLSVGLPDGFSDNPTTNEYLNEQINWVGAPD
jgi:hypothetical protein